MLERCRAPRHRPFHIAAATLALVTAAQSRADIASPPSGAPKPAEIRIVATEFKYAPSEIKVTAGRAVTLVLDNSGAETEHGIFVPALGFRLDAKAGEVVRRVTVFDKAGKYDFSCDLPGHPEAGMRGKLIVGQH
ncbi:MAG TPA: cupredoxin domain-containing protein [Methylocella sp.]|nr:cupredoxin domain-containing protein [Methylocella sp.]